MMKTDRFLNSLQGTLDHFKANYHTIDNLNVFPVPDGDTGVNMLLTIEPAVVAVISQDKTDIQTILEILKQETMMNSRGNSGFILSQFINGFSDVVLEEETMTPDTINHAFTRGHFVAKTAISTPREGTMLSVFEAIADFLGKQSYTDVVKQLEAAVKVGMEEVFRSPEKLPVLKKAGVVDSGALGFVLILDGLRRALTGEGVKIENEDDYRFEPDPDAKIDDVMVASNRYCTELTIQRNASKEVSRDTVEHFLKEMGDSVALLVKDDIIKLHVHTNEPEVVLEELSQYGETVSKKIEDMQSQIEQEFTRFQHVNEIGVLVMVPGEGFRDVLHNIEPDLDIMVYGKHLPKTGDILHHVDQMPYDDVIIMPNDKNIIPAVQLVKNKTEKHIEIFPSKNVIQGVAAMMGFVKNLTWQENISQMKDSKELVDAVSIYKGIKDSNFGGIQIPKNHYFAVMGGNVIAVNEVFDAAVLEAMEKAEYGDRCDVCFYYNDKTDKDALETISNKLQNDYDDVELQSTYGGQHTALLLISME